MDGDDLNRILRQLGVQLPELEENVPDNEIPPSLDDLDENDLERGHRDWRKEWERNWDDDDDD